LTRVYSDTRSAHPFCSSRSSHTSASDGEKRVVDHAVARSVSAVCQLASDTPLFVRDSAHLQTARWTRKEGDLAEDEPADSKGQLIVGSVHPGCVSALAARSSTRLTGRAS
jgi:hypothetical protein